MLGQVNGMPSFPRKRESSKNSFLLIDMEL